MKIEIEKTDAGFEVTQNNVTQLFTSEDKMCETIKTILKPKEETYLIGLKESQVDFIIEVMHDLHGAMESVYFQDKRLIEISNKLIEEKELMENIETDVTLE